MRSNGIATAVKTILAIGVLPLVFCVGMHVGQAASEPQIPVNTNVKSNKNISPMVECQVVETHTVQYIEEPVTVVEYIDRIKGNTIVTGIQVENLDACNYGISFNPTVLRLDNITGGDIDGTVIPVDIWNERSSGTYTIVQNIPGLTGANGTGYLAELHFHVIGSVGDTVNIGLSNGVLSSNLAQGIPATWMGDLVEVSVIPGDANGDGNRDALDITKVERIIAGLDAQSPGADANMEGSINALDITGLERIIVGLD